MNSAEINPATESKPTSTDLQRSFLRHLQYTLVKDKYSATKSLPVYGYGSRYEFESKAFICDNYIGTVELKMKTENIFVFGMTSEQAIRHSRRDLL